MNLFTNASMAALLTCLMPLVGTAQPATSLTDFNAREFLTPDGPRPKVLLVGSFHFSYPNLDSHVTEGDDQVNFESAQRREELQELVEYVARFKPTKIVVEARDGSRINNVYRDYLRKGLDEPRTGEIYQLAFPLGKQFGVDSLVLGDSYSLSNSMYFHSDSLTFRPYLENVFDSNPTHSDTMIHHRYWDLYATEDKLQANTRLLDIFRQMNNPDRVKMGHGHYIQFLNDQEPDALAINWYSRNLRIYNRITRAITSPNDRVLVLFGAGHLGILTQQLESDVRYEQVRFGDL